MQQKPPSSQAAPTGPEDASLIARAARGDEDACTRLVRKYERAVWACTLAVTGNREDAADAAQEAFIRFFRRIDQYDARRPLRPYLLKIAANCGRTVAARRRRLVTTPDETFAERDAPAPERPDRRLEQVERRRAVVRSIDSLPPVMRQVCRLFYIGECSIRETALALGMSESAVKTALHRARKQLAPALARWQCVES